MNSILETEPGLPPGLWLPTSEEPTDQFRVENFAHGNHPYYKVVELGTLAVALAVFNAPVTGRVDFMPNSRDIDELHAAGYGLSLSLLLEEYGGLKRLQKALDFWPEGYVPEVEELFERFEWFAQYALPKNLEGLLEK